MRRLFFGLRRRRRRRQRQVNTKVSLSPTLSPLRTPESEATDRSTPSRTTARIITMSGETYPLTSSPIEDEPATYPSSSSNNDYGRNRNKIYQSHQQPLRPALTRSFSSEPTDQTPVRSSTKHERVRLGNGNAIGTYLEDQDTSLLVPASDVNNRQPSQSCYSDTSSVYERRYSDDEDSSEFEQASSTSSMSDNGHSRYHNSFMESSSSFQVESIFDQSKKMSTKKKNAPNESISSSTTAALSSSMLESSVASLPCPLPTTLLQTTTTTTEKEEKKKKLRSKELSKEHRKELRKTKPDGKKKKERSKSITAIPTTELRKTKSDDLLMMQATKPPRTSTTRTKKKERSKSFTVIPTTELRKTTMHTKKQVMEDKEYIYVQTLGVKNIFQGKGYGGLLLRLLLDISRSMKVGLYLETESESNESLYKHFGFQTLETMELQGKDDTTDAKLKMWLMYRPADL